MRRLIVLLWTVSRRELAARPVRSMLVAGTIATGVALLTAMRVATDSTVTGFAADLERMGGTHLIESLEKLGRFSVT